MSPPVCDHVFSAWSTAERINEVGERTFVFQQRCYQCPHIDEEAGAIVEEQAPRFYAKVQKVEGEPDD